MSWLFPPWGLFSAVSTIMWNAVKRAREGKRVAERRANAAASTGVGRVVVERS